MSKKENILLVHNYYKIPGGEDTVVENEKHMLEKHGHKVILYTRKNAELDSISPLKKLFLPFETIFNTRTFADVKRLIKEHDIDIVHVHNTLSLISPSVYYAALACSVPVVQTVHNFRLLCPGALFYRNSHICEDCVEHGLKCAVKHNCYRGSRAQTLMCVINTKIHRSLRIYSKLNYICLTDFNREKLLALRQIKPERAFVKPNFFVADGEIVPKTERENRFVFAGRLDKIKGIDVLFEAWKHVDNSILTVCGTGPEYDWCKEFIRKNNINNIELLGLVQHDAVIDIIAHSRALMFPTQWYEGFPMSIAESMSVGTPVICSDIGNAGALIKDGVNGIKVKHNDIKAWAEAVINFKDMEVKCDYGIEENYNILIDIYNKARGNIHG